MLPRSIVKSTFNAIYETLIQILAPEEVYPAELRGYMLIEIKFRIVRSLQRSEIVLKTIRSYFLLGECIKRFSFNIMLF
jgi:hypothetical protein